MDKNTSMEIKRLRNLTGLSQSKFAKKFCLPTPTLQNWEHGTRRPPEYVVKMIELLLEFEQTTGETVELSDKIDE